MYLQFVPVEEDGIERRVPERRCRLDVIGGK